VNRIECGSMNHAGEVVGLQWLEANGGTFRAVRCQDGAFEPLPPLTQARDINDRGEIAGIVGHAMQDSHAAVLSGGKVTDLGTLGGPWSFAYAINRQGDVAGVSAIATGARHAFLWHNGKMTDLGTLGGATSAAATLNDAGDVGGSADLASGESHAFLFKDGKMTDLGILPGTNWCGASGINAHDDVVGTCGIQNTTNNRAVLFRDGKAYDLNDTVTVPLNVENARQYLQEAWSINDGGEVIGQIESVNQKRVAAPITDFAVYRLTPRAGAGLVGATVAAVAGFMLTLLALVLFRRPAGTAHTTA
jgi:probable HAF family extracellular repeat protein